MILPVDFIDVSRLAGSLALKYAPHFKDDQRRQKEEGSPHHDTEVIVLRAPLGIVSSETWFADVPHEDMPLLSEWAIARQALALVADSHQRRSNRPAVFGKVMVTRLKAGGTIDWHVDEGEYAEAHDRFHLCLHTSQAAFLYSNGASLMLQPGTLAFFDNRKPHGAANFGSVPRDHLIVDIRKPAAEEVQE